MEDSNFGGSGRKRPLVDVKIKNLRLDNENPRLAEEHQGKSQDEILKVLYNNFDLEEIGFSMSENGYFDEEPIVVIPNNLPDGFLAEEESNIEDLEKRLAELEQGDLVNFTVVEGNRRVATAMMLTNTSFRNQLDPKDIFPKPKTNSIADDLKIIPCIVYFNKKLISPYLGIRHIKGNLRWESYAKAVYLARIIEEEIQEGNNVEDSIQIVKKRTADRTDTIKRQYLAYKILNEVQSTLGLEIKQIKKRFSLITELTNRTDISDYLGIKSYKQIDFTKDIIPASKHEEFRRVFIWVFGDGRGIEPLFGDSRLIPKRLAPILADKDATEYLIKHNLIEEAYERSGGEKAFLINLMNSSMRKIEGSLSLAYKYKDDTTLMETSNAILAAAIELNKTLSGK